ncbi:MAG: tRNA uridine-5-carboxymethylaminomethyl(34) synthesis enzyme MnmG [Halanaerobiaceae bacterium]
MSEYGYEYPKKYDVIVIGAGHAGSEASLAPARMGFEVLTLTVNLDHVAFMPCNPSLGGPGKAHIVREIDALGGEMARNMDETMIQIRMLNTAKGPAVYGLRGQADKKKYHLRMKNIMERQKNLDLKQEIAERLVVKNGRIQGVVTKTGIFYRGKKIIITTGTFLKGKIIIGEATFNSGPNQQYPANKLSESLQELGFNLQRFKTGTPPRVNKNSIDFSKMQEQKGEKGLTFSFSSPPFDREQVSCWLTYTNEETHEIIRNNKERTPLFSGDIEGIGPRYCPSLEDKVIRYPDKGRHQIFLEPEGELTDEYYVSGFSTSLPEEIQVEMIRTLAGMENVDIMRPAYAIEYDCLDPVQLKLNLETKKVSGLYSAGQINGTSGYEEAAGQGLIAGINAALSLQDKDPLILDRSEAYIGVLIDELVTKGTNEPYRIMTSRAEYRLMLRQDNADLRLTPVGYDLGLISEKRYKKFVEKRNSIEEAKEFLNNTRITPTKEVRNKLKELDSGTLKKPTTLEKLLRRPEVNFNDLEKLLDDFPRYPAKVKEEVGIQIKYKGYIDRQLSQIEQFKKMENKKIPENLEYNELENLRTEAKEKLNKVQPESLGQASRISGVSPADISVLMVYLEKRQQEESKNG